MDSQKDAQPPSQGVLPRPGAATRLLVFDNDEDDTNFDALLDDAFQSHAPPAPATSTYVTQRFSTIPATLPHTTLNFPSEKVPLLSDEDDEEDQFSVMARGTSSTTLRQSVAAVGSDSKTGFTQQRPFPLGLSDEEMLDLNLDGKTFLGPHSIRRTSQTNRNTSKGLLAPLKDAPRMAGQYDDFETIDWVKDVARDRLRHREVHKEKKLSWRGWIYSLLDSGSGWFCALLIGAIVGLNAGFIDIASSWLSDLKEGICKEQFWLNKVQCCWSSNITFDNPHCNQWFSWSRIFVGKDLKSVDDSYNPDAFFVGYLFFILWGLLFSTLAVYLVRTFAPYACGSGIPEIKTILSGFIIRGYLGKWTLVIKSLGMMLAVSAGLSVGKEGPMVHMAACVGNVLSYRFPKYGNNEAKKREMLSAAVSAGVSSAFGAPIGGVLFSLEEASYYFPLKTLFRSFFCAMCAAYMLRIINPFGNDHLVMFQVDYKNTTEWHVFELVPFAIIGALGGVFGALFIRANLYVCHKRKTTRLGMYPIREVLIVTLVTLALSFPCTYLRMNTSELIKLLVNMCGPGNDDLLCQYDVNMTDKNLAKFGNYPAKAGVYQGLAWLSYALIVKIVLTIFTFGVKVPTGLFIPSMAVGAIMGRMVGVAVEQWSVAHHDSVIFDRACQTGMPCINHGLYAMVGAAAGLGGVTRMTISLVVIMLELTGGLTYILPLMVAAMMSKWVGDLLTSGSIYEEHIKLNGYPYLKSHENLQRSTIAADVMRPRPRSAGAGVVAGEMVAVDGMLHVVTQEGMNVGQLENILATTTYNGFPVVLSHDSHYIVGYVTRRDLCWALEESLSNDSGVVSSSPVYFTEKLPVDVSSTPVAGPTPLLLRHILDLCPVTVTDQTPMDTVLDFFRKLGLRQLLVSHNGRLLGIITKKDLLLHIQQLQQMDPASLAFS